MTFADQGSEELESHSRRFMNRRQKHL